ncbi:MAG: cation:proton antiporter [Chloroflexi bacterium]|nr:cation:proton antiporter [Chloroflexota bacterium]
MEANLPELVAELALQLGIILIAAKIFGEIFERFLRQPAVLGELLAGVVIGPLALGGLDIGPIHAFFPIHPGPDGETPLIPVSPELFAFGQIAAVVLLFETGLNTNLKSFLRFAPQASVVAIGGVVLPFVFGDLATVLFGFADGVLDPAALFVGTIMTATSVGITARVLDGLHRLDSPEGVTILGAAVVDDVLGILILTIVAGMGVAGTVEMTDIAVVGAKALGFWIVLTGGGILLARHVVAAMNRLNVEGATLALAFALALIAAAVAEMFGLAMIIGAYSVGLALSQTDLPRRLEEPLRGLYHALVPVFFVVMGMLVDVPAMISSLAFGLVIVALALVGKVAGAGIPAYLMGFSPVGAWRVGVGMAPRGEVGLIVAGIGVAEGIIDQSLFGVAVLMTVATTFIAPIFLIPAFRNDSPGLRRDQKPSPAPRATL